MKKVLAAIIAAVMTVSLMSAIVIAYTAPGDDGDVAVPYVPTDMILIDGKADENEWPDEPIALDGDNLVGWYMEAYNDTIMFETAWNENGLYIYGGIQNTAGSFADAGLGTRFQIALNPGGLIDSNFPGLFFSLVPYANTDELHIFRHNWKSNADEAYDAYEDEGYEGKYTYDDDSWCFECIIPWSMIATADRKAALNSTNTPLTEFDPEEEGAFCTAMICYIPCEGATVLATGRTCKDGDVSDWNVSSYDVTLLFGEKTEIPVESESESQPEESGEESEAESEEESEFEDNSDESESEPDESEDESEAESESEEEPEDTEDNTPDAAAKDINGDGYTDNKDVVSLFRYVSGSEKEDDESKYDVNGDGLVDNKDVVALFRALSKITKE